MEFFKVFHILSCIFVAFAEIDHDADMQDSVTLLQAQVEQSRSDLKLAATADIDDGPGYKLEDSLSCASEAATQTTSAPTVAMPAPVEKKIPVVVSPSEDPACAGALRVVFQVMIILLICDAMRRWNLRKQALCSKDSSWTEMVNAANSGDARSFEAALGNTPQVMQADAWGCTPLHFAAAGGSVAIATALLERGADIDALDASDETPLHFAARAGHAAICEMLLGSGAKKDAVNVQNMTPLIVAGHAKADATCRLLVEHGAGVAGLTDEELPPLVVTHLLKKMLVVEQ